MPVTAPMLRAEAIPEAVERIGSKTPIASALSARRWAGVPLALRERAQFSAKVTSVRFVSRVQDKLLQAVKGERVRLRDTYGTISPEETARREAAGQTVLMTRDRFIGDMRRIAEEEGIGATGPREVEDVRADTRLGLIYDMQVRSAHEFAKWKAGNDPDALDVFPAQRLVRVEDREVPRGWKKRAEGLVADPDNAWEARWARAGEQVGWEGAAREVMVALKSSPIWTALSAFGVPWPPFDYASGMGVEDVGREEAERLGLLSPGEMPAGDAERDYNDGLQASVAGVSEEGLDNLREAFGNQIEIRDDVIRWRVPIRRRGGGPAGRRAR